ncbi:MAG: hypothetical protein ACRCZD_11660 [Phycicoccus sp.]
MVIEAPDAVRILIDRKQVRFLAPFLADAVSPAAAARTLGVSLNVLLPRIRRFVTAGLLDIDRVEPRRGRPVRFYRAVAPEFFVPLSHVQLERDMFRSHAYWDELFRTALEQELSGSLAARVHPGVRVACAADGSARIELAVDPQPGRSARTAPLAVFEWFDLRLSATDARELQHELVDVLDRFRARQQPGARHYVVGAQLAPLPPGVTA